MTDIDLKTETPDTSINDSAFLFGADSQAAGTPSVYPVSTVRAHFVGAGTLNVASAKTLTASNTLTLAGTDGTTMTFPSTSATLARTDAGNTFTGSQTLSGGTITTDSPVINASQTWNAAGVTFTGLKLNATDTASASASLLLDIGTGGGTYASKFNVSKAGTLTFAGNLQVANNGVYIEGTAVGTVRVPGVGGYYGFTTNSVSTSLSTLDTFISRRAAANLRFGAADAAAPVAQTLSVQSVVAGTSNTAGAALTITGSQGTGTGAGGSIIFQVAAAGSAGTAQNSLVTFLEATSARAFNLYNTTDVTTNYERGALAWTSNILNIGTEKAGTGSIRDIQFNRGGTGVAQFMSSGFNLITNLIFNTDNSYDIGQTGAFRPRSVYVATSVTPGRGVTVAGLPTPSTGMIARVTDALAPTIGATVAGGGAAYALVNYNGANWTVIGV